MRDIALRALVGSHNYNLNDENSDKDFKVFLLPTFEDLYNGTRYSAQTVGETEDFAYHDIRQLSDLLFKSNINFLEVLASSSINIPRGNREIHEIFSLKNEIFKINLPYLFNSCRGMSKNKVNLLNKPTEGTQNLVDKFGYNTKEALHAFRVLKVLVDYEKNGFSDFEKAIRYEGEDREFMLGIKDGKFSKSEFEDFIETYREDNVDKLSSSYGSHIPNLDLKKELEAIIMKLVRRRLLGKEVLNFFGDK